MFCAFLEQPGELKKSTYTDAASSYLRTMHFRSILSIILSALECARGLTGGEGDVGFTGYGAIYWPCYDEDQRALNSYNAFLKF